MAGPPEVGSDMKFVDQHVGQDAFLSKKAASEAAARLDTTAKTTRFPTLRVLASFWTGIHPVLQVAFLALAATANAETFYVTVAGVGGEPEYEQRFTQWAKDIEKSIQGGGKVVTLSGTGATKAQLDAALKNIAREAKKEDSVVLMIVGHGSFDGIDYKVQLPGPDITGVELASILDKIPAKQLVVNMTSASGASLAALKRQDRAVITATKSGTEKNATIFARYWVEALQDPAADADKNEVISALEAYKYAQQKTAKFYESNNRLATEHCMIEDTGRGEGARDASPQNGLGLLASRFPLLRIGSAQAAAHDPAKQELLKQKQNLEEQIDQLKYMKAAMPQAQYREKLGQLLTNLAKVQAELDK